MVQDISGEEVASWGDQKLMAVNGEYKQKRLSDRLGQPRFMLLRRDEFIALAGGSRHADSWEAQLHLGRAAFKKLNPYPSDNRPSSLHNLLGNAGQ
jgi:hypothetical protein